MSVVTEKQVQLDYLLTELIEKTALLNSAWADRRAIVERIGELCEVKVTYWDLGRIKCENHKNPIGVCLYHCSDYARDNCRYCNLPEERK